ncbi:MAG: hypothetical protein KF764_10980 [Labilithrix sp.]|nr:hypothetical protein [Labilithrix sp.]MBX3225360.1 hypothetical protein [Labilithrix sp.]
MAADDKETTKEKRAKAPGLPPRVERALALAREAAAADRQRKGGRWLAILPVSIAALLLLLMMPRATAPDAVPLPRVNERVLAGIASADDRRAAAAEVERLPSDILAIGTALRALNGADVRGTDELGKIDARRQLDGALRDLARRKDVVPDLVALRAIQTRRFLDALRHWERTGETSEDFLDLAGSFVLRASDAGWVRPDRTVLLTDTERRVMFKTVWNVLASVDTNPALAIALDEQRALYAFYIQHPRPPESSRLSLETERLAATTPAACAGVAREHRRQVELWRADKIKRLGAIDPSYPTSYALGVAYYRAGRFDLSADAFTTFIGKNPDGPYALLAKNHLKAALAGGEL